MWHQHSGKLQKFAALSFEGGITVEEGGGGIVRELIRVRSPDSNTTEASRRSCGGDIAARLGLSLSNAWKSPRRLYQMLGLDQSPRPASPVWEPL